VRVNKQPILDFVILGAWLLRTVRVSKKQIPCNEHRVDQLRITCWKERRIWLGVLQLDVLGRRSGKKIHRLEKQLSMQLKIYVKELVSIEALVEIGKQKTFGTQSKVRRYGLVFLRSIGPVETLLN